MILAGLVVEVLLAILGGTAFSAEYLPATYGLMIGALIIVAFQAENRKWILPMALAFDAGVSLSWSFPADPHDRGQLLPIVFQVAAGLVVTGSVIFAGVLTKGSDRRPLSGIAIALALGVGVGFFSSGVGGAGPMFRLLTHWGLSSDQVHLITLSFRKTFHFCFYGSLGLLVMTASKRIERPLIPSAQVGVVFALITACFDELRQSSQPGRTGSAYDVLLDLCGAITFAGIAIWAHRRRSTA